MVDPVTVLWSAIGASAAVFVAVRLWARRQDSKGSSLGSVSEHWLAEQRLDQPDSNR